MGGKQTVLQKGSFWSCKRFKTGKVGCLKGQSNEIVDLLIFSSFKPTHRPLNGSVTFCKRSIFIHKKNVYGHNHINDHKYPNLT